MSMVGFLVGSPICFQQAGNLALPCIVSVGKRMRAKCLLPV
jgi:hypothetical protein